MRLVDVKTFQLVEYFEPNIPPYAILSHRWETEEVLFADIQTRNFKHKAGFRKISLACNQAVKDDLAYVWVDTCCIDKSSSAELSEAINSMFQWYAGSAVCYAFLSDVVPGNHTCVPPEQQYYDITQSIEAKVVSSVWFTRGWTLQELIAPGNVVFYNTSWEYLGTRCELASIVSDACSIDARLLNRPRLRREILSQGNAAAVEAIEKLLQEFSIAEKMSWYADRQTTRLEDRAYSLMGIFGVHMPLLYGEGKRAFLRLQEEISKVGVDLSILAWSYGRSYYGYEARLYYQKLFADSPSDFEHCSNIVQSHSSDFSPADQPIYSLTSTGLRIERPHVTQFPVIVVGPEKLALSLGCQEKGIVTNILCLKLQKAGPNSDVLIVGWSEDSHHVDRRLISTWTSPTGCQN